VCTETTMEVLMLEASNRQEANAPERPTCTMVDLKSSPKRKSEDDNIASITRDSCQESIDIIFEDISYTVNLGFRKGKPFFFSFYFLLAVPTWSRAHESIRDRLTSIDITSSRSYGSIDDLLSLAHTCGRLEPLQRFHLRHVGITLEIEDIYYLNRIRKCRDDVRIVS